ncbi:MAG TPA: hypothetical protein VIG66_09200 [Noviherbaspirillum sp.]
MFNPVRGVNATPVNPAPRQVEPRSGNALAVPAAASPAFRDRYEKGGSLANFNIHASLAKLDDVNFKKITPDQAEYFLRPVRLNSKIKSDLKKLERHTETIEAMCVEIDRGNWKAISHLSMSRAHPPKSELHDVRIKDMLFYAYAAGRISRAEFNTAHMVLNVKEQFEGEILPQYEGKVGGKRVKGILPMQNQETEIVRMFEKNGGLTGEGEEYLAEVADNLERQHNRYGTPRGFEKETCMEKLEAAVRQLPENLQMFYYIQNDGNRHDSFFQELFKQEQMPYSAAPSPSGQGDEIHKYLYSPSSGMLYEMMKQFSLHPVEPALCLGTIGGGELASLHMQGFHPSSVADDRVKSNHIAPHGVPTGRLFAAMHDEHFHCMLMSYHSPIQRKICCVVLPNAVHRATDVSAPFEKAFAEKLVEQLADMPSLRPHHLEPQDFLEQAMRRAVFALLDSPEYLENGTISANLFENYARIVDFQQKCLEHVKATRTGPMPFQNMGALRWDVVENNIAEYRQQLGMLSFQ